MKKRNQLSNQNSNDKQKLFYNEYERQPCQVRKGVGNNNFYSRNNGYIDSLNYLYIENINKSFISNLSNREWIELNQLKNNPGIVTDSHKMKFSDKDFFSKFDQTRSFLQILSHLLKNSLMENFICCAVYQKSRQGRRSNYINS